MVSVAPDGEWSKGVHRCVLNAARPLCLSHFGLSRGRCFCKTLDQVEGHGRMGISARVSAFRELDRRQCWYTQEFELVLLLCNSRNTANTDYSQVVIDLEQLQTVTKGLLWTRYRMDV